MNQKVCFFTFLFLLSSCSQSQVVDGQYPPQYNLKEIIVGDHSKDDVLDILGTPSTIPSFDKNKWFYIEITREKIAFLKPKLISQKVLQIDFDNEDLVSGIETYSLKDGNIIAMNEDKTLTQGKKLTIWEQLFSSYGNLGDRGGGANRPTQ